MSSEHETASYDDVSTRSLLLVGVLGVILVVVTVIAVQAVYYRYEQAEFERKVIQNDNHEVEEIIAAQKDRLTTGGEGAHPELGEKSIPISQAMELVIQNYQSRQRNESVAGTTTAGES